MRKGLRNVPLMLSLILSFAAINVHAQNFYHNPETSSELLHQLKGLNTVGTVMYIAAHPDDENTRLISYLTNERNVNVTYLSLTRGDGGQNLVGPEIREGLGIIRTQELLQARATDGGSQMFTRANDFGYSKSPEESFRIWDREQVLADVVWAIRNVRPDVIITRFSTEKRVGRSTHGHHTASAILASEAFELAGDKDAFPEQLKYVDIWEPKRLFWNTSWWFYGDRDLFEKTMSENPGKYIELEVGGMVDALGHSCSEIASLSRSHHKSQGFGSTPDRGEQKEYLQLLKGENVSNDIFDGMDLSWKRLGWESYQKQFEKIVASTSALSLQESLPQLCKLHSTLKAEENASGLEQKALLEELEALIFKISRIYIQVTTDKELVPVGAIEQAEIMVVNRMDNVEFELVSAHCSIESPRQNRMAIAPVRFDGRGSHSFNRFLDFEMVSESHPYWLNSQATVGMYHVDDQRMIGKPENGPPVSYTFAIRMFGAEFTRDIPLVYSHTDPVKGEQKYPVIVTPPMMINLEKDVYLFPTNEAKSVMVEVIAGDTGMSGYAELNVPDGWKCEPAFHKVKGMVKGERKRLEFMVTPSKKDVQGTISAYFKSSIDDRIYGNGFQHIVYDHIPPQAIFSGCTAKAVKLTLALDPKIQKIGYVDGAGDQVGEALRLMGYQVQPLTPSEILSDVHMTLDAVMIGIRAYNTVPDMAFVNDKLNAFVEQGGVVVVQYNTSHRLVTENIGPYTLKLSRDRVTEEDAEVTILEPENAVVNWPNKLEDEDFDLWVQERGLYFPDEWDDRYAAIFRMGDTNDESSDGSLLVAEYGDGRFVYTGISFFRELPAGVPGAYRLLANLLSVPEE